MNTQTEHASVGDEIEILGSDEKSLDTALNPQIKIQSNVQANDGGSVDAEEDLDMEQLIVRGCNMNSDEIPCLVAERPSSSSDSDENLALNYSQIRSEEEKGSRRLDDKVTQSWLSQDSADSSWSLNQDDSQHLISHAEEESDMEEFRVTDDIVIIQDRLQKLEISTENNFLDSLKINKLHEICNENQCDLSEGSGNCVNKNNELNCLNCEYLNNSLDDLCDVWNNSLNISYTSSLKYSENDSENKKHLNLGKFPTPVLSSGSEKVSRTNTDQVEEKPACRLNAEDGTTGLISNGPAEKNTLSQVQNKRENISEVYGDKPDLKLLEKSDGLTDVEISLTKNELFPLLLSTLDETGSMLKKVEESFTKCKKRNEEHSIDLKLPCINCADVECGLIKNVKVTQPHQNACNNQLNAFTCRNIKSIFIPNPSNGDTGAVTGTKENEMKSAVQAEFIALNVVPEEKQGESASDSTAGGKTAGDLSSNNVSGSQSASRNNCINSTKQPEIRTRLGDLKSNSGISEESDTESKPGNPARITDNDSCTVVETEPKFICRTQKVVTERGSNISEETEFEFTRWTQTGITGSEIRIDEKTEPECMPRDVTGITENNNSAEETEPRDVTGIADNNSFAEETEPESMHRIQTTIREKDNPFSEDIKPKSTCEIPMITESDNKTSEETEPQSMTMTSAGIVDGNNAEQSESVSTLAAPKEAHEGEEDGVSQNSEILEAGESREESLQTEKEKTLQETEETINKATNQEQISRFNKGEMEENIRKDASECVAITSTDKTEDKVKSIIKNKFSSSKHVTFGEHNEMKQEDLLMEPVAANKEKNNPVFQEMQPDLATALRFMTEVYPNHEDEDVLSDPVTTYQDSAFVKSTRKKSPSAAEIFEEMRQFQSEGNSPMKDMEDTINPLKSPQKFTEEGNLLEDAKRSKSKSGNKFSKFFKSFRRKIAKKT